MGRRLPIRAPLLFHTPCLARVTGCDTERGRWNWPVASPLVALSGDFYQALTGSNRPEVAVE